MIADSLSIHARIFARIAGPAAPSAIEQRAGVPAVTDVDRPTALGAA